MPRIGSSLRRGILALTGLAGGISLLCHLRPDPAPGSLADLVQQARAREHARRQAPRPVTHGVATADSAFEHYTAALQAREALQREQGIGIVGWDENNACVSIAVRGDRRRLAGAELASFRSSIAPIVTSVQRGTHAGDMTPRPLHDFLPLALSCLLGTELAARLHEGDADGAVALWLDKKTFELDVECLHGSNDGVWTDTTIGDLTPSAKTLLAAGLSVLDDRLNRPLDAGAEIAKQMTPLLEGRYGITDWSAQEVLASWEFGFDPTARHLAAFESVFAQLHRLEPASVTGRARAAQWDDFAAAERNLPNRTHMSSCGTQSARWEERLRLSTLTYWRQLRIGLAARLGEPLPELRDPFTGERFRCEQSATVLVVHAEGTLHGSGPARWTLPGPSAAPR